MDVVRVGNGNAGGQASCRYGRRTRGLGEPVVRHARGRARDGAYGWHAGHGDCYVCVVVGGPQCRGGLSGEGAVTVVGADVACLAHEVGAGVGGVGRCVDSTGGCRRCGRDAVLLDALVTQCCWVGAKRGQGIDGGRQCVRRGNGYFTLDDTGAVDERVGVSSNRCTWGTARYVAGRTSDNS